MNAFSDWNLIEETNNKLLFSRKSDGSLVRIIFFNSNTYVDTYKKMQDDVLPWDSEGFHTVDNNAIVDARFNSKEKFNEVSRVITKALSHKAVIKNDRLIENNIISPKELEAVFDVKKVKSALRKVEAKSIKIGDITKGNTIDAPNVYITGDLSKKDSSFQINYYMNGAHSREQKLNIIRNESKSYPATLKRFVEPQYIGESNLSMKYFGTMASTYAVSWNIFDKEESVVIFLIGTDKYTIRIVCRGKTIDMSYIMGKIDGIMSAIKSGVK